MKSRVNYMAVPGGVATNATADGLTLVAIECSFWYLFTALSLVLMSVHHWMELNYLGASDN
jgi:hypothetical protein